MDDCTTEQQCVMDMECPFYEACWNIEMGTIEDDDETP